MSRWIVTGARAPVALDLARALRTAGHEVHLADSVTPFAARGLRPRLPIHRLPPPRQDFAGFRTGMLTLLDRVEDAMVVPTCEEVFWLAEAAHRDGWSARLLAPPLALLRQLHSKADFAGLAGSLGLDAPETHVLDAPFAAEDLPFAPQELVLKPEFSRFASSTLIAPGARQIAAVRPAPGRCWVAQRRIIGEEVCSWAFAVDGRITAFAAYRPRWRQGRAAAFQMEAVALPAVREVSERITGATGLTGHLSLDTIVDAAGRVWPIECNPRAVSGLHLFDAAPGLAGALSAASALPEPPAGTLRHLAPAMALLGLPSALLSGRTGALLRDWRAGGDAIDRERGGLVTLGCLLDAARFAAMAIRSRQSPASQTTADIEWDGKPMP
ncbi:hypothetical protein [Novosphingobium sp.]|uniref:hypothetical protein n=1 Tax=Novosphingobium sp. TaxID=1874826 RepID=UPI001EC5B21F|nr:hypothetical protein [Novosphingobium sp.]MBK6801173.1 hypothetical protein [Novosphingobium sp.]MBK9011732.1 hypothetical protein [Novosphingobium sp.]